MRIPERGRGEIKEIKKDQPVGDERSNEKRIERFRER